MRSLLAIHFLLRADTSCSLVFSVFRQYSNCKVCLKAVITNLQWPHTVVLGIALRLLFDELLQEVPGDAFV